jgi:hypothetical protein
MIFERAPRKICKDRLVSKRIFSNHVQLMLAPLSPSSRPSETKTDIGLSLSIFRSVRGLCATNSRAFSTPSRGGGTSLDQAMLTKTLRPSGICAGLWLVSWVDATLSIPGCSSFDFTQKPGEGETSVVTFRVGVEDVMSAELSANTPARP